MFVFPINLVCYLGCGMVQNSTNTSKMLKTLGVNFQYLQALPSCLNLEIFDAKFGSHVIDPRIPTFRNKFLYHAGIETKFF